MLIMTLRPNIQWPYSYDSCDVGTVANQSVNGAPTAASTTGDPKKDYVLSYLPGQRLSRCTCPGESHPGPMHSDGSFVGRAAPEIDMFEAQIKGTPLSGQVSQSAQWAVSTAFYPLLHISCPDKYTSHLMQVGSGRIPQLTRLSTTLQSLSRIRLSAILCNNQLPS